MAQVLALVLFLFAGACYANPGRIVGGNPTTVEQFGSIAQVEFRGLIIWSQSCACNILNSLNVLSAAHCFDGPSYSVARRRIRAGTTYRNSGGIIVEVEREYNHPSYGQHGQDGDITVVRLSEPLPLGPTVQQATIISHGTFIPGSIPVVHAGWGITDTGSSASELHEVSVYTVDINVCRNRYSQINGIVTDNMICAGMLDIGGKNSCQGDAGGPLYLDNIVIGIVSWGLGCDDAFYPRVNTAVSSYTNWIVEIAQRP